MGRPRTTTSERSRTRQRRSNPAAERNGAELVAWMDEVGISPEMLAKLVGVGRAAIYEWRIGYVPRRSHAALLARVSQGRVAAHGWD